MSDKEGYLFVGGPAHGRMYALQDPLRMYYIPILEPLPVAASGSDPVISNLKVAMYRLTTLGAELVYVYAGERERRAVLDRLAGTKERGE